MNERAFVYNPADGDFDRALFTYNSREFPLAPNAVNEIVSPWPEIPASTLLAACLQQLGVFGVVAVENELDEEAGLRGEAIHEAWLRKTHGKTLADFQRDQDRLKEAGIPPVPMKDAPRKVQAAHAKLKEWGVIAGLLLLSILGADRAQATETARHNVLSRMFTTNDWFGMPPSSGDPFTCNAGAIRSMYYDTATDTIKFCNGSSWASVVAGGLTIGTTSITSGTSGRVLFDNAGVVGEDGDFSFVTDTLTVTKLASTTLTGTNVATGRTTFGTAADAANAVDLGETAGRLTFEGATADAFEGRLGWTDPTVGDQVLLLPNLAAATTDTVVSLAATQSLTNKTIPSFELGTAATDTTITRASAGVVAVEGVNLVDVSSSQTLTNKQMTTVELGAASDTTIARTSAGVINVEGVDVLTQTNTLTGITNKTFVAPVLGAATGTSIAIPSSGAANAVEIGETANRITFEGATADAFEGRLGWTDPTVGDQTILFPDLAAATTDTVMTLATSQTVTAQKILNLVRIADGAYILMSSGQGGNGPSIMYETALTPDGQTIGTGSLSNSWHVVESADGVGAGYDFQNCSAATSAATDPLWCIHSHNQTTTQWIDLSHNATNGRINVGLGGLDVPAHIGAHGTAPTVSACGVSPTTVTGSDGYGRLTTGSGGTVQSCTLTFATAFAATPVCVANDETTILLVRATPSTTALVIDSAVAGTLASQVITYVCHGL